ncbi:MAG: glycosyltransferase family 4 protein [Candidatus Hadarchaeum sp.]
MKISFLYPASGISPHPVHLAWAKSVGAKVVETPMGIGFFDVEKLEGSELLLLESLYCAPFAKRYKKKHPNCKVISLIADTSFWPPRLSIARKIFYRMYLGAVDGFLADSNRIRNDIKNFIDCPVGVVRPFAVNRYNIKKREFTKTLLFIGNEAEEKGYRHLVRAMEFLPDFDLFLAGNCCKVIKTKKENIHLEGWVSNLREIFEKCSIYVHPADFEPFGVAPLEAMHAGLIPIITKDVGLSEMFDSYLSRALILKSNKPIEIANRVFEVYSSKERGDIVKKCKKLARSWTEIKSIKLFRESLSRVLSEIEQ